MQNLNEFSEDKNAYSWLCRTKAKIILIFKPKTKNFLYNYLQSYISFNNKIPIITFVIIFKIVTKRLIWPYHEIIQALFIHSFGIAFLKIYNILEHIYFLLCSMISKSIWRSRGSVRKGERWIRAEETAVLNATSWWCQEALLSLSTLCHKGGQAGSPTFTVQGWRRTGDKRRLYIKWEESLQAINIYCWLKLFIKEHMFLISAVSQVLQQRHPPIQPYFIYQIWFWKSVAIESTVRLHSQNDKPLSFYFHSITFYWIKKE